MGKAHVLCETTDQSALSDQLFKGPSKCQLQLTGEGQCEEILWLFIGVIACMNVGVCLHMCIHVFDLVFSFVYLCKNMYLW